MTPQALETSLAEIQSAIDALTPERVASRTDWTKVGMALHSYDSGLFEMWDAWSRLWPDYDKHPGSARRTWNSFKPGGGVTIRDLFDMAEEDGWIRVPECAENANPGAQEPVSGNEPHSEAMGPGGASGGEDSGTMFHDKPREESDRKMVYRIVDWDQLFENNRTRDMREMKWVPVPNKHDGDGYRTLIDRPNGGEMLGCWVAILQVASKCRPRGTLLRNSAVAHDSTSISRITGLREESIKEALDLLVSPEIGWIEVVEIQPSVTFPHPPAENRRPSRTQLTKEGKGKERKGKEEERRYVRSPNGQSEPPAADETPVMTMTLKSGAQWPVTPSTIARLQATFPGIDLMPTLRFIKSYFETPRGIAKRKTERGIETCILAWIKRDIDDGKIGAGRGRPRGPDAEIAEANGRRAAKASELSALIEEIESSGHESEFDQWREEQRLFGDVTRQQWEEFQQEVRQNERLANS